jgi:hypothetical protein
VTSFLIKSALFGSALLALGRLALRYLRARCAQVRRNARFCEAADAGLARHRRQPGANSLPQDTDTLGRITLYVN